MADVNVEFKCKISIENSCPPWLPDIHSRLKIACTRATLEVVAFPGDLFPSQATFDDIPTCGMECSNDDSGLRTIRVIHVAGCLHRVVLAPALHTCYMREAMIPQRFLLWFAAAMAWLTALKTRKYSYFVSWQFK